MTRNFRDFLLVLLKNCSKTMKGTYTWKRWLEFSTLRKWLKIVSNFFTCIKNNFLLNYSNDGKVFGLKNFIPEQRLKSHISLFSNKPEGNQKDSSLEISHHFGHTILKYNEFKKSYSTFWLGIFWVSIGK